MRYPHESCHVGGVPDVVNHAKFHQNRFKGFAPLMGRNLPLFVTTNYLQIQLQLTKIFRYRQRE